MAAANLLALLDDISTLLDDVATLSKVAVSKTSGVVGDDLALNAEQVLGFKADRELPVVWAVAKGSLVNKVMLVPAALLISAFAPTLVLPLLMVGGAYLCYEGFEKVFEKLFHGQHGSAGRSARLEALADPEIDLVALERHRIKGAIRTDFILSAEIVVIALGTMATAPMPQRILALALVGLGVTVLVYGLVAAIVKLDDLGLRLLATPGTDAFAASARSLGSWIIAGAPYLMRTLGIVGTAAMFLIGGSIIAHGIAPIAHLVELGSEGAAAGGAWLGVPVRLLLQGATGVVAGGLLVAVVAVIKRLRRPRQER